MSTNLYRRVYPVPRSFRAIFRTLRANPHPGYTCTRRSFVTVKSVNVHRVTVYAPKALAARS
eukprot:3533361-Rhodomonas_salina.1